MTTPCECVWTSIRHSQPDRVPHYFSFTQAASRKLEAHYGTKDLDSTLDNDMVRYSIRRPALTQEVRPGFDRDEFGVVWNWWVEELFEALTTFSVSVIREVLNTMWMGSYSATTGVISR